MAESKLKSLRVARSKNQSKSTQNAKKNNKVDSNKLELLVTVIDRNKAEFYADLLQSFEVNMQMMVLGQGTAKQEILNVLGLASTDKMVIFSIIKEERLKDALYALDEKFRTIKNGKGIAYTIPLSSVIGAAIYAFLSNNENAVKGE